MVKLDIFNISYGTAQGSCLGPFYSFSFINDIQLLQTYSHIILFADDTTMLTSHKNMHFLRYMLEHDMNLLSDWYKANQLSLNVNKTVLLKFWSNNTPFNIHTEQKIISNSNSAKFLGLIIDENLTWILDITQMCNKLHSKQMIAG